MELDTFLSKPRWDILRIIAEKPSSPLEIAHELHTTISFISQQLKLLEAAGLVKKSRTGNVEKGKPRALFSISNEMLYLVPLGRGFADKKSVNLTKERGITFSIWSLEDEKVSLLIEKVFWKIHDFLDDIDALYVYTKSLVPKLYLLSKRKDLTQQINNIQKEFGEKLPFEVVSSISTLSKIDSQFLIPLFDPHRFFSGKVNLKGGRK